MVWLNDRKVQMVPGLLKSNETRHAMCFMAYSCCYLS